MKLNKELKKIIKVAVVYGLLFALGMYLYNAFNNKPFQFNKFILNFFIFAILQTLKELYLLNKRKKEK